MYIYIYILYIFIYVLYIFIYILYIFIYICPVGVTSVYGMLNYIALNT